MHFALFIRDENVCVGYCTLKYASVSYDFGVIGGTLYLTRDACTMTRRLFNIFGYAKENYLLRNLYVISVQRKLMIFNTFLFIYLFFCYNYSFIYSFLVVVAYIFFFLVFLYESQKTNNGGISFFRSKYYFSRALSLIIFSNIS